MAPALLVCFATLLFGCPRRTPDAGFDDRHETPETETHGSRAVMATIVALPDGHPPVRVTVEVVRTAQAIEQGLMYRRHLPADRGMLFLMGIEDTHLFWMRNTYIPLDIIFIDKHKRVVGLIENAEPLSDEWRSVAEPSLYVLEVNAGWAQEHHVHAGTRIGFEGVPDD